MDSKDSDILFLEEGRVKVLFFFEGTKIDFGKVVLKIVNIKTVFR